MSLSKCRLNIWRKSSENPVLTDKGKHYLPRDTETDERQPTYILPEVLKTGGKALEDVGIHIVYGPNPIPAPEMLSDQAKKASLELPLVPMPAKDAKGTMELQITVQPQISAVRFYCENYHKEA